jgi:sec-independent protein translocase protein TatB
VFDSIGWGEVLVIALAALFIFGPERLPTLARDAAAGLKKVRGAISDVRAQVDDSLGDDLADLRDLDLRRYHPRTFIRDQLFGEEEDFPLRRSGATASGLLGDDGDLDRREPVAHRDRSVPPPFDYDAT